MSESATLIDAARPRSANGADAARPRSVNGTDAARPHGANGTDAARPHSANGTAAASPLPQATTHGRPLVLKFGGSSLGTPRRMRRAALRVRHHQRAGRDVVVVVSAAGATTDRILGWLDALGGTAAGRERDRALATGEERTAALLAAALVSLGVPAFSLRGGEAGLHGAGAHGAGELRGVVAERVTALVAAGVVPVVAGFQAARDDGETLTLGRGASDLTAVALAAALDADECHIVTDVDGVYDADPRAAPHARRHDRLTHDALVRIVERGACVVHAGAARHAREHGVTLRVYDHRTPPRARAGTHVTSAPALVVGRSVRTVRVALAGCGVVNGALARTIASERDALAERHGVRLEFARVLVRRSGVPRAVPEALLTTDVDALLAADADVVVEALGGVEPAGRIARATLARGARLVTANKALLAHAGDELARLAARSSGTLDFEAAVGAALPVVRVLRETLAHAPVQRIRGILNGTCNYVLTLLERGAALDDAVRDAQRLGFAEADPTRDLDGSDAADKIRVLAWLAYGVAPATLPVRRTGLDAASVALAAHARATGGRLRLVAECARAADSRVEARVEPVVVPADSPLGRTEHEQNRVLIELAWGDTLELAGAGAGAAPTAAALLGDVLRPCAPLPAERSA